MAGLPTSRPASEPYYRAMLRSLAPQNSLANAIHDRLAGVAEVFTQQLTSDLPAVNELCRHVEKYRGKMMRPMLVLASGAAAGGVSSLGRPHLVLAAVVEMIHMATLVHDDVLDEAEVRRGGRTVNSLQGNEAAVMLGDYLISKAFHLCSTIDDPSLNQMLGRVTNTLCEGELLQLAHRGDAALLEGTYFEIVRRKTAVLTGGCCAIGARLSGADAERQLAMQSFGEDLGIAFQIQDDVLDLMGEVGVVGKTVGRDIAKGKLTLPVVIHLASCSPVERAHALAEFARADGSALRDAVVASGSIAQAHKRADAIVERAKRRLTGVAEGEALDLLLAMADATVTRPA
ncbi:MAG: polyprenyl synthetase family protein [Phycisphaerales bacterium]|nr:polyprenyl synthetase family protein [Phycisphaerales bacterium]